MNRLQSANYQDRATDLAYAILLRLNPKTQSLTLHVDGMRTTITPSDVAASLAGLPPAALWIAKALTLCDPQAYDIVRSWLLCVAIRLSHKQGWGIDHEEKKSLADIVYSDALRDRCPHCRGRGQAPDLETHKLAPCEACSGIGFNRLSWDEKAERFGVKRRMYFLRWRHREAEIMNRFIIHENQVVDRIKEKFGLSY